jgi:hypothetical protein
VFAKSQELQLQAANSFFGQLSQLQRSENSKIAAVGKAAAIAQAIINTYQAATAAYASLAGIPVVGPALGAAAAGAAVVAGLANVAQIRAQPTGFKDGGYTGDVGVNSVAGVVHGREFVVNAQATARNRQALENINRGGTAGGSPNITIQNFGTSKEFEVQQLSETEIRVIARDEAAAAVRSQAPGVVATQLGNPNSSVSKSLARNTQTARRR